MKKIESAKAKVTESTQKTMKVRLSPEQHAIVVFAANSKGVRVGEYINNIVVEQAEKDFKEKVKGV
jgi:predicted HicB family RNase H-like nuclease